MHLPCHLRMKESSILTNVHSVITLSTLIFYYFLHLEHENLVEKINQNITLQCSYHFIPPHNYTMKCHPQNSLFSNCLCYMYHAVDTHQHLLYMFTVLFISCLWVEFLSLMTTIKLSQFMVGCSWSTFDDQTYLQFFH